MRVAQTDAAAVSNTEAQDQSSRKEISEIIVTAQKRSERLQDVPVPVTAISADTLVDSNQLRLLDYSNRIPGFSVRSFGISSTQVLTIRGISSGDGGPTVGVMVDDVPYGGSTGTGGGSFVPDIDPGELSRVEVLRGPQGTLYGANSMGGLIKFVTVDPSTESVSGHLRAGLSSVRNGSDIGYNVRAAVNVPLSDTLAIRASAFTRLDPGYIDNPILGTQDINEAEVEGARVSALWRPSSILAVKLSALLQNDKAGGSHYVLPALGDFRQTFMRGTGSSEHKAQAYNATVTAKVGQAEITALSGYSINSHFDTLDLTQVFGPVAESGIPAFGFDGFGVTGAKAPEDIKTKKFSQEVRLAAPFGERIEGLVGVFYADESNSTKQNILAVDPATGGVAGDLINVSIPVTYKEYAVFANLTYHFTDRFDIQFGARESRIKQTFAETDMGPLVFGGINITPEERSKANAFTYLVTPRFKVSSDLMVYARLASGYRAGGPNPVAFDIPPQSDPDKTKNYEIGLKGNVLDNALSFDASLYYIDWEDLQVYLNSSEFLTYQDNVGAARSRGIELSLESRPLKGLTIAAWAAWNDAVLTAVPPEGTSVFESPHDRLPYTTRFSGSLSVDQEFSLPEGVLGYVGGSLSYVGDRLGSFLYVPSPRSRLRAYAQTDLRAGARYDAWTVNLFINNVTDKRGVLNGGPGSFLENGFVYIQPRMLGVSVSRSF